MKTIIAYGYMISGNNEIITEIEEGIKNKAIINWNNFNTTDDFYDDNGNLYHVEIDHEEKTVKLN